MSDLNNTETATFATGCFWCTEAVSQQLEGVIKVTSGYSGGHVVNPTYEEVCNKKSRHAECLNIECDKTKYLLMIYLKYFGNLMIPLQ